jgi:hypothetical protein
MIIALVMVAFDLGVLARCGGGSGVCFDTATHATTDAALIGFFVLFIIGLMLILYTEAGSSTTRTESAPRSAPQVTIVNPPAAAPATSISVNTPAPAAPPTRVTVNSP